MWGEKHGKGGLDKVERGLVKSGEDLGLNKTQQGCRGGCSRGGSGGGRRGSERGDGEHVRVALHVTPPSTHLQVVEIFTPLFLFVITPQPTLGTPHNNLQCSLHQGVHKVHKVRSVLL